MNTEIMNNIEEVTEMATENVVENVDNGFGKGMAVGVGAGLLIAGGIKLAVTGIKKFKAKKNAKNAIIEVEFNKDSTQEETESK